jgi:hypothetical protein
VLQHLASPDVIHRIDDPAKAAHVKAEARAVQGKSVLACLGLGGGPTGAGVVGHAQVGEDLADIPRQPLDGRGDGIAGLGPDDAGV